MAALVVAMPQTLAQLPPPPGGGSGDGGSGPGGGDGGPSGGGSSVGGGDSCDQCGASASYSEQIVSSSGILSRDITTNGCPNHYSICTGKEGLTGCGSVGEEGTASEALMNSADGDGSTTISVPAEPVFKSSATDVECEMGAIAIALNGVGIFGGAVDTDCNLVRPLRMPCHF